MVNLRQRGQGRIDHEPVIHGRHALHKPRHSPGGRGFCVVQWMLVRRRAPSVTKQLDCWWAQ